MQRKEKVVIGLYLAAALLALSAVYLRYDRDGTLGVVPLTFGLVFLVLGILKLTRTARGGRH